MTSGYAVASEEDQRRGRKYEAGRRRKKKKNFFEQVRGQRGFCPDGGWVIIIRSPGMKGRRGSRPSTRKTGISGVRRREVP